VTGVQTCALPISKEDFDITENLDKEKKHIIIINKTDLPQAFGEEEAAAILPFEAEKKTGITSLSLIGDKGEKMNKNNEGILAIESIIESFVMSGVSSGSSLLVTKARQKSLLEIAKSELAESKDIIEKDSAPEFAEVNLRAAWEALGEMIGERATDDVIERVFEEFCVGK
jgi:tRNA modification GTPase